MLWLYLIDNSDEKEFRGISRWSEAEKCDATEIASAREREVVEGNSLA